MSTIKLSKKVVQRWSADRKKVFEEVIKGFSMEGENIIFPSFEQVKELAEELTVPIHELIQNEQDLDLNDGVKVCRKEEGFTRTSERKGSKYYTYQHLVTTNALPTLMALRVTVHCNEETKVVPNGGHSSFEFIYVAKGDIRMHWETEAGLKTEELHVGDSVYIHPNTSHSFMAMNGEEAELIAVNF